MSNVAVFGGVTVDISQFNFDDHSSRVHTVRIVNIVLIILVAITITLRMISRAIYVKQIFIDDIIILFAAAFTIALASVAIAATYHGLGTHLWLLPLLNIVPTMKSFILHLYICQILYLLATTLTKISIITSYLRFFHNRHFYYTMCLILAITTGLCISGVFVTLFQCNPISAAWDFTLKNRKCINYKRYLYASSSLNIMLDVLLCVVPWPHFWRLRMPVRRRIILCTLFAGGIIACVACMVRIAYVENTYKLDTSFESVVALLLSVVECVLGIFCISIPALRPLAEAWFGSAMSVVPISRENSRGMRLHDLTPKAKPKPKDTLGISTGGSTTLGNDTIITSQDKQ